MDFTVPLSLVTPGELAAARFTGIRFLTGVGADMGCQMVATAKVPQADPALERFLSRVDANVTGELVATREPPIAAVGRARVRSLVRWCLARPTDVLSGFGAFACGGGWETRGVRLVQDVDWIRYLQQHTLTKLLLLLLCVSPAGYRLRRSLRAR